MVKTKNECQSFKLINTDCIVCRSDQPRKFFDDYELSVLCESIKQNGILQPLSVRRTGPQYELIAGERRLRAAKMAGLKKVPCIIFNSDDASSAFFAIIENLQRQDLTFFEEAAGIGRLITDYGMSHCDVAARLGIAQSTLSNKLRLLALTPEQQRRIVSSELTERHARALLRISPDKRDGVLDRIIASGLNLKETEKYIQEILNQKPKEAAEPKKKYKSSVCDIRLFANSLSHLVDTMVNAGIPARQEKRECRDYIEYKVKIPKPPTDSRPAQLRLTGV